MGFLRRRYPAQQLRTDGEPQTDGNAEGEETEQQSSPPRQSRRPSWSQKKRSYPLQQISRDRLQQGQQSAESTPQTPASEQSDRSMREQGSPRGRYYSELDQSAGHSPQSNGASTEPGEDLSHSGRPLPSSPSSRSSSRRRPYPFQATPVDKLPRIEPSTDQLRDDASVNPTPSTRSENTTSENGRRRAYPSQSLPIDKNATPRPSREELRAEMKAQHIPPSVHAVKDHEATKDREGRALVVCLDGTGDKFDSDNSNIVHIVSCLKKDHPSQVTYYQAGIGTYSGRGQLVSGIDASLDMAVGSGLGTHICDAYKFLMQTYMGGDRICLFGFSRGAYTARCLAGMIHKVGLLPAHNEAQVLFAYEMYKDDTPNGWAMSAEFKKTFCTDVRVYFIGVFDTVASVGLIPRKLPLSSNPACQAGYFRHAIALDEHRAKFKALPYGHSGQHAVRHGAIYESEDPETNVLEVHFLGAHADVGGGAVKNIERHALSRIPLRWMLRQTFECDTGLLFHTAALAEQGLDVHTLWPQYKQLSRPRVEPPPSLISKYREGKLESLQRRPRAIEQHINENKSIASDRARNPFADDYTPGPEKDVTELIPEQTEDYFDCLSPINDQLESAYWTWAPLELWPIKVKLFDEQTGQWTKQLGANLMRYRPVKDNEPSMHWTVRQRMETMKYAMKVRTGREVGWRVVV